MSNKYQPIGNNILVEGIQISTTLALPGNVEAESYVIVELGTGDKIPQELKKGDTVLLNQPFGLVAVKNTKFFITDAGNVACKVS